MFTLAVSAGGGAGGEEEGGEKTGKKTPTSFRERKRKALRRDHWRHDHYQTETLPRAAHLGIVQKKGRIR